MKLREWNARLHGLVIFRALLDDPVVAKLLDLTRPDGGGYPQHGARCATQWLRSKRLCLSRPPIWGEYLSNAVLETETVCVRQAAAGGIAPVLQSALDSELHFLQELCGLTLDELFQTAYSEQSQRPELAFLPRWETKKIDLAAAYAQRMQEAGKKGYGMFAKHHVFTVEDGRLVPVKYPDPQRLSELPGYERERGEGHRPTPGPCWRESPPTTCCCMVTRAPASPAPSRPSPMPLRTRACGWWKSRRTSSTRSRI